MAGYVIAKDDVLDCFFTADSFADRAISVLQSVGSVDGTGFGILIGRYVNSSNYYRSVLHTPLTNDFQIQKYVNAVCTTLAQEAVSLTAWVQFTVTFSISGTTLKAWRQQSRNLAATPTLTATDTSISSGRWGGRNEAFFSELLSPASPSPQPIAYFEVPVIGSGIPDDPFRAQMPEEIVWDWSLNPSIKRKYDILKGKGFTDEEIIVLFPEVLSCRANRLSLTHSSLIVSEPSTGKPKEYTAIVRVFEQPDRQTHLRPISRCIEELRTMRGVKELTKEEAIRKAKMLDDKLTDVDLLPIKPTDLNFKRILNDYIAHREAMGVKRELIDDKLMERYLSEDKGWG